MCEIYDTLSVGGKRAWRNNNPGNIGCGSKARKFGSIGCDGSRAIFPDEGSGIEAHKKLLTDMDYRDLTLAGAIRQWAPSNENPTEKYIGMVSKKTGIDRDKVISEMTPNELNRLQSAMSSFENNAPGEIKTREQMEQENLKFMPGKFIDSSAPTKSSGGVEDAPGKTSGSRNPDRWWERESKVLYSGGHEMQGGNVYIGGGKVEGGRILYPGRIVERETLERHGDRVHRVTSDGGERGSFYSK